MDFATMQLSSNDQWMTPKSAWEAIQGFIPRDKTIWECFRGDGTSAENLRDLGFDVVSEDEDFFENDKGEIIVSNMPFSIKKKVFSRLLELNKPFIMIVPSACIHTKYFNQLFKNEVQLIVPSYRIQFINPNDPNKKSTVPFTSLYVCYKMHLPKDLIFI